MSSIKVVDINNEEAKQEEAIEQPIEEAKEEVNEVNEVNEVVEERPVQETNQVIEETKEVIQETKPVRAQDKMVRCPKCNREMKYKHFRYGHQQRCQGGIENKPVKPHTKARAKPVIKQVEVYEEPQETKQAPKPVIKQQIPQQQSQPTNPLTDITNHYQLLQNQYIQQRKKNITIFVRVCSPQNLKRDNNIIFSTYNYIIMSNLTLDGSTSFIGTEFIKLLATGSSNLATEEYVDDAIAENGGGGGGNVDLSNYYTQTETDNLLNNKLNVINPQDITGNLRLDPTNGLSKIILNAVSPPNASDDFYCNGNAHINGTLRVSVLTSDGDVNCDGVNADTFNSNIITNDTVFKHNDVEYMRFNAPNDTIDLSKELNLGSSTLKINSISTNGLNDMTFNVDTLGEFLRFNINDFTVRVPNNRSFLSQNIFTDIIKPLTFSNDVVFNGGNSTNDAYEEYVKINSTTETVDFNKHVNFNSDIDVSENIVMLPNKILYLDEGTTNKRYIRSSARSSPSIQNHLDIVQENTSIGRIRLMIGSEENLIVENSQLYSLKVITAVAGVKEIF